MIICKFKYVFNSKSVRKYEERNSNVFNNFNTKLNEFSQKLNEFSLKYDKVHSDLHENKKFNAYLLTIFILL